MKDKHQRLTRLELFQLGKLIEGVLKPDGEQNGHEVWRYQDGWNDERISKDLRVHVATVRKCRQDMFGHLRRVGTGGIGPMNRFTDRISDLEARVAALEDALTKPRQPQAWSNGTQKVNV